MNFAYISSIVNFARGVGNKAESSFAYFGNALSLSTQKRIMAKIIGNDANGRATKNTLTHKQSQIMQAQTAIIIACNNYQ